MTDARANPIVGSERPTIVQAAHGIPLDVARARMLAATREMASEAVALSAALGRRLSEEICAGCSQPPFDSSAMDGFAVRASDLESACHDAPVTLRLSGESRAGRPSRQIVGCGEAVAISTGAMLPAGADAIVRLEQTRIDAVGHVRVLTSVACGADVRRAGEFVGVGTTLLAPGTLIGPAQVGVLASLGLSHIWCFSRPRVKVLTTGDELLRPGERARPGALYDSNGPTIAAMAAAAGADSVHAARIPDDHRTTESALTGALPDADLVVICGGMSVGRHDHVRPSLAGLGACESFSGIALKPGHPTWFGSLNGVPVLGLPGNPLAAALVFELLGLPALRVMHGAAPVREMVTARLAGGYRRERPGRTHAVLCTLEAGEDGCLRATPVAGQAPHLLGALLVADGVMLVDAQTTVLDPSVVVTVLPLAHRSP